MTIKYELELNWWFLFLCFFQRYLFPGIFWGFRCVDSDVALQPASRTECFA